MSNTCMSLPQGTGPSPFLTQQSHIIRAMGDLNSVISTTGAPLPSTLLDSKRSRSVFFEVRRD